MAFGYLIDMDGVVYRGGVLIPGANTFFDTLQERQIPFLLLTNNSQRARRDVVLKMTNLGVDISTDHVFTCAMSTARFLASQKPNGSAYVIGEGGILNALHQNGYAINETNPDYVVVAGHHHHDRTGFADTERLHTRGRLDHGHRRPAPRPHALPSSQGQYWAQESLASTLSS